MCALTYAVQDSGDGSSREFLITPRGEEAPDVGPDLLLPVGQLHQNTGARRQKRGNGDGVGQTDAPSHLVFGELLHFLRCIDVASVPPLVKVLGEEPLQLEAATLIQVVHAGRNAAKSNAAAWK